MCHWVVFERYADANTRLAGIDISVPSQKVDQEISLESQQLFPELTYTHIFICVQQKCMDFTNHWNFPSSLAFSLLKLSFKAIDHSFL